jgi:hypothetical protein
MAGAVLDLHARMRILMRNREPGGRMGTKTRRVNMLMEPEAYYRLATIAEREGVSVAELVRRAVEERYLCEPDRRSELVGEILAMELPVAEDWDELEAEIEEAHAGDVPP